MTKIANAAACAVALGFLLAPVEAQPARYPVKTVDFDIWCTEIQHIAWQRCDKRLPDDMAKFETYRHTVERYEIPYLKQKDNALRFDEDLLHNDPVLKKPDATVQQPPGPLDGSDH
jgi:hypothetical protein